MVGVDYVSRAVERARAAAGAAGANVRFAVADVTRLQEVELGRPFDVVYDVKCFHGLPESSRPAYVEGVRRSCRPGGLYLYIPPLTRQPVRLAAQPLTG